MKSLLQSLMLVGLIGVAAVPLHAEELTPTQERASIRTQLAAEYFTRRQFGVALEEAKKALLIEPKYAPAHNMLALINAELREDDTAREHFLQALSLAPTSSDIHHNYGVFLCDRGERQTGIAEFMLALKNPLYLLQDKTLVSAGLCAEKSEQPDAARGYYERALRFNPDNAQAKLQLSGALLAKGLLPEARRYLLELTKQKSAMSAEVLWLGVRIERKLGNRGGELHFSEQLRRQYPDSLEASRLLAGQYD